MDERLGNSLLTRATPKRLAGATPASDPPFACTSHADIHTANRGSGDPGAGVDWNDVSIFGKTNAAAEEQFDLLRFAHREKAGVFQEKGALFRKENVEAVQGNL